MRKKVLHAGTPRYDQKIIKQCEICGQKYHPRMNGYELISRFCSMKCVHKSRRRPQAKRVIRKTRYSLLPDFGYQAQCSDLQHVNEQ